MKTILEQIYKQIITSHAMLIYNTSLEEIY